LADRNFIHLGDEWGLETQAFRLGHGFGFAERDDDTPITRGYYEESGVDEDEAENASNDKRDILDREVAHK